MRHTYTKTIDLINDARKFGHDPVALVKSGAYHRLPSGVYVADTAKAPKTYIL